MEKIKKAYYYLYYAIHKSFSKDSHLFLSTRFRADIVVGAFKIWTLISIYAYLSVLLGYKIELSITEPLGIIPIVLALGTTLYFFTFSNKWKPYFEEFEKISKRKNLIGIIIVWCIVILSFINLITSVNLMKEILG